ncbi:twin-arginine translocase TatA/TatE family subunit [Alphaproteobacteria bacterium]|nr:twin-arginine translocase TatA/TatE family subunit [Alphaproteobacteria bacterium]
MFGGSFSILHWIVVLAVVLLLFGGRGKVSAIMGDFGKGLRNFKTGLKGPETEEAEDDAAEAIEDSPRPAKKAAAKKAPAKKAAAKKTAAKKKAPAKRVASRKASAKK